MSFGPFDRRRQEGGKWSRTSINLFILLSRENPETSFRLFPWALCNVFGVRSVAVALGWVDTEAGRLTRTCRPYSLMVCEPSLSGAGLAGSREQGLSRGQG